MPDNVSGRAPAPPQPPPKTWTIATVLSWTAERFEREGVDSARLDAELLLADSLGVDRMRLYLDYGKPLTAEELASYRARVKRRLAREPVAYITGRREFWSLELEVNADVLVPRPDTELIVELAAEFQSERENAAEPMRVLDVGTGSGALAIAIAHELGARVDAVDDSPPALEVARRNAARHDAEVTFILSDLLAALPRGEARYDLIVSNPPYIASAELDGLMPEVSRYEPRHALDGGADGLDVIRRLLAEAIAQLRPDGALLVEIGSEQGAAVAALFEQHGLAAEVKRDLAGHDRVVRGTRRKA